MIYYLLFLIYYFTFIHMKILALDIGTKRTGAAFADSNDGVPMALETIHSTSDADLVEKVQNIIHAKSIEKCVVGFPLLLSGSEGSQSDYVKRIVFLLKSKGLEIDLLDERYTTPDKTFKDPDSASACQILQVYLDRLR